MEWALGASQLVSLLHCSSTPSLPSPLAPPQQPERYWQQSTSCRFRDDDQVIKCRGCTRRTGSHEESDLIAVGETRIRPALRETVHARHETVCCGAFGDFQREQAGSIRVNVESVHDSLRGDEGFASKAE